MKIRLMNKVWKVVQDSTSLPKNWDGSCDPATKKAKSIHLRKGLHGERHLEVAVHEMLHACDDQKDEYAVATTAKDIARALWRLGYRRTQD